MPPISFFEFRRLVNAGELDGVIIAAGYQKPFTKAVVKILKFYNIVKVGIFTNSAFIPPIYWLDTHKIFLPYLEADITDKCNLHCAACYHFSNFSTSEDSYPIEDFQRDIRRVSQLCDIVRFRLMGGEPLLLKNLDQYIKFLRQSFPKADLRILTNGLLIPSLPQKILDAVRDNRFSFDISTYAPTTEIAGKINAIAENNKIPCNFGSLIRNFNVFLTLNPNNNPLNSRRICGNENCRSIHKGKIYKCPLDAFSHKFSRRFGIENFPASVGIDIFDPNFPTMIQMLDDNIELCHWCGESVRQIPWKPTNNPQLEDWLSDPDELKNFS